MFLRILTLLFLWLGRLALIVFQGNPIFTQQSRGLGLACQVNAHGLVVIPLHQVSKHRNPLLQQQHLNS